ncbi:MAG: integrase arm-type DNA-binding domain-containing protein [Pseudomonadota bacterium]
MNRLTTKGVAGLKKPGLHGDGGGLYLNVKAAGSKSWTFIYSWNGRRREKGMGPFPAVSLHDARSKRDDARKQIVEGVDPLEVPAISESEAFGQVATALINDLEVGWKNPKHRQQWRNTLETYCKTIWSFPVASVGTGDIVAILKPIWHEKPETASRLRARIERVLDAAKVRGLRSGDNPARWRGHLQLLLPGSTRGSGVRHHPAMPYAQLPDFVIGLKTRISTSARALEFLILTWARTTEVLNMTWSEVDLDAAIWTVPAERMKMGVDHVVPLSDPALRVLRSMAVHGEDADGYVFPGQLPRKPLSGMSMEMLLRRMGCDDYTVHGFRSSARDWAGEETDYPREVAEWSLAHQVGDSSERAYRRSTALAKRRNLLNDWAQFLVKSATDTSHSPDDLVQA